jgi:carbon monoxide dehydrogenase subunit G
MTTIESKHVAINNTQKEVFEFLGDLNNFKLLLPQDKISNWKSDLKSCSFKVNGMATISLILASSEPNKNHHIVSGEESPFPFTLDIAVEENGENSVAYNKFVGEINPFLRLMVEKPLTNLFNYIADKLAEVKKRS